MKGAQVRKTAGGNRMHSRKSPIQTTYRENLWKTGKPPEFDPLGSFLVAGHGKQGVHEDEEARGCQDVFDELLHASPHLMKKATKERTAMTTATDA